MPGPLAWGTARHTGSVPRAAVSTEAGNTNHIAESRVGASKKVYKYQLGAIDRERRAAEEAMPNKSPTPKPKPTRPAYSPQKVNASPAKPVQAPSPPAHDEIPAPAPAPAPKSAVRIKPSLQAKLNTMSAAQRAFELKRIEKYGGYSAGEVVECSEVPKSVGPGMAPKV